MNSEEEKKTRDLAYQLERAGWFLVFLSMLTQLDSQRAFPSYNTALGFWGIYCAFGKHGRATFGFIMFSFFAVILDICFCSLSVSTHTSTFNFCLTMLVICLFIKLYCLYIGSHFFAAIGGAYSMESSRLTSSNVYEPLSRSMEGSHNAAYYPPEPDLAKSDGSFGAIGLNTEGGRNIMMESV